ncbi:hematopoietic progenitor cell antigen CD34 isoform X1 [Hemicordylus capensis]|uniref:hematopoietic progenitor cell antigen CD34 isoform X1 n=1 Tax=Hemicordylus capensis TaxID=884348 RepID=UPI0023020199|nr:hematopoietic progenitor cell antigen CD34 isoform X1 [Hemicordylus capensis]
MMILWSFKAITGKQLFWRAVFFWTFCALSLLEYQVASDDSTTKAGETITITTKPTTTVNSITTPAMTKSPTVSADTSATPEVSSKNSSTTEANTSSPLYTKSTSTPISTVQSSTTQANGTTQPDRNGTSQSVISSTGPTTAFTKNTTDNSSVSSITSKPGYSSDMTDIKCINIKQMSTRKVICLELNETYSCDQFKNGKGAHLKRAVCRENQTSCYITLAKSDVKQNCILLVTVNGEDGGTYSKILQEKRTALDKVGIKPHEQEDIRSHQDFSRKTVIAVVTAGLLLSSLGLAGYFFKKRQSWSPRGERLGEDPYCTENDSHSNTVISVASHEQSNLQDKPNLNGGAQENGTGQPASKNGHSARPHVVADTEL